MAQDFHTERTYPIIKNFSAVQTWTDVILPSKGKVITVGCEQHDIYVSFEGTEGQGTSGVNKLFIKSGGYMSIKLGRGTNLHNTFQVATKSSASAEVTVIIEEI